MAKSLHPFIGSKHSRILVAVWTAKQGHILDEAEERDTDFFEHIDSLDRILNR
jgi:hypothetical protein